MEKQKQLRELNENMEPLIEYLRLEDCEWAVEQMEDNGKIRDIEKLQRYLEEEFQYPLKYILEWINEHLYEAQSEKIHENF